MGTYTTNYNLFMPSIGEQGWGDLVNGNFSTIDTTMKGLNTRLTAVENEVNGNLSCTSVATSGTLTSTGKITANGGIGTTTLTASSTSTFTGKITANGGIGTKALSATSISNSGNMTNTGTLTSTGKIYANGGIEVAGKIIGVNSYTVSYDNNNINPYLKVSDAMYFYVLPYALNTTYSGSLQIRNISSDMNLSAQSYWIVTDNSTTTYSSSPISNTTPYTITFSNIRALFVRGNQSSYSDYFRISKPILS